MSELCLLAKDNRQAEWEVPISTAVTTGALTNLRMLKVASGALTAGNAGAVVFAWQNPESNIIIVREVIVRITVAGGTGSAAMDIGVVANASSTAATIFDGIDLNATGVFSSQILADTGASGTERPHVVAENGGASDWITGYEEGAQNYSNLVGAVYIFYTGVS